MGRAAKVRHFWRCPTIRREGILHREIEFILVLLEIVAIFRAANGRRPEGLFSSLPRHGWCEHGARACYFGRLGLLPLQGVHPVK